MKYCEYFQKLIMLKYSKSSNNLAVKCLALADFCKVDVTSEISDQDIKLALELSGLAN